MKEDIVKDFLRLQEEISEEVTRRVYRKYGSFSTNLIEKLWGSWGAFISEAGDQIRLSRGKQQITKHTTADKVVITYAVDGENINSECWGAIKNYAKENNCDLFVLWGKPLGKLGHFSKNVHKELKPYLATEIVFDNDWRCTAKDLQIPCRQKNPLINLDKLSNNLLTFIVGATKQYMKIMPYAPTDKYKVAWSTGTISIINYDKTVSGELDSQNHTLGALVLEYSKSSRRYIVRNLMYKNGFIADLDKNYTECCVSKENYIPAMVLGDLHLPEEDHQSIQSSIKMIQDLKVKYVVLHDIFSFNSISHHDFNLALTRLLKQAPESQTLEVELKTASEKLDKIASQCKQTDFYIVHSNHDDFIMKYLNTCDFVHDMPNVLVAMELFLDIAKGQNPLKKYLTESNITFLPQDASLEVSGFELGQHGSIGIGGAKGSPISYSKTYKKSVSAHTHSPQTFETAIVVGTNSQLKLNYNAGITTWAHSNVIIHGNGTYQHIFLD